MEAAQRGFGSQSHSKVQLTLIILFKCDALRLVLRAGGHRSVPNMIDRDHTGQGRDGCILGELEVKGQVEVLSVVWWNKAEGGAYSSFSWSGRPEAPDDSDCAPTQSSSCETFWKARTPTRREKRGPEDLQQPDIPTPEPEVRTHSIQVTQAFRRHRVQTNCATDREVPGKKLKRSWPAFPDTPSISSKPGLSFRWRSGPCTQNRFCPHLANSAPDALCRPIAAKPALSHTPEVSEDLHQQASSGTPPRFQQPLPCPSRRLYLGRLRTAGVRGFARAVPGLSASHNGLREATPPSGSHLGPRPALELARCGVPSLAG